MFEVLRAQATFTCNAAVNSVAVGAITVPQFVTVGGKFSFSSADKVELDSVLVALPHGLVAANAWSLKVVTDYAILPDGRGLPVSVDSDIWIYPGSPIDFGENVNAFLDQDTDLFGFTLASLVGDVSMVSLPTSLDAEVLTVDVLLLLRHTSEVA